MPDDASPHLRQGSVAVERLAQWLVWNDAPFLARGHKLYEVTPEQRFAVLTDGGRELYREKARAALRYAEDGQ